MINVRHLSRKNVRDVITISQVFSSEYFATNIDFTEQNCGTNINTKASSNMLMHRSHGVSLFSVTMNCGKRVRYY